MRLRVFIVAVALGAPLAGAPLVADGAQHGAPACGWPMYGHDPGHSFAQSPACAEISAANVAALRPKWFVETRESVTASPTVVDGTVYVGAWDGIFYAVDAGTGEVLWKFEVEDAHEVAFGRIVSSAAVDTITVPRVAQPVRVVLFGGGGTLYALEHRKDRAVLLARQDVDPRTEALKAAQADDPPEVEIESSPLVGHFADGDDRIFVGMDVHNAKGVGRTGLLSFGLRRNEGGETPYRFELLYKFDPETGVALHSLTDGSGGGWGCGGVWSSPALDPTALGPGEGVIVFGTANCDHPDESVADDEVGGEAVFGIEAKTGRELWRFTPRGPNELDDDFGSSPNLLPGGLVGEGSKDGWYYALDRVTGEEAWRAHAGQSGHVSSGFAVGGIIGTPAVGTVRDPLTGESRAAIFATTALPTPVGPPLDSGEPRLDTTLVTDRDPTRVFAVHAIDAATGEIIWRAPLAAPSYGAPTYANGVLLVPVTFGFQVQALDAGTGLPLWTTPTLGAPSSAPAIVGDSIYFGAGTRETDLEFKAFGDEIGDALGEALGAHPLSRLSGIFAYELVG